MIDFTKPTWQWDVFGVERTGISTYSPIQVTMYQEVSLRRRILTRIFLGSKWTRLP